MILTHQTLNIVQITDPHLHASQDGTLLGMNTQKGLDHILERIQAEQNHIDLVLATGDIAQDGSVEAYRRFIQLMQPLNAPLRWTAGNHDKVDNMKTALEGHESVGRPYYEFENWVVILLDSTVPGKVYGRLADDQLALLDQLLTQHTDKHALVTFHHHPCPMGSVWMDKIGIDNPDDLQAVLGRHNNVRCLLWGHVHQASDRMINNIRHLSTPSTCVQFTPKSDDFDVDTAGPGYRWLQLQPDGQIDTGLTRVEDVDFEIDFSIKGY
ncbi:phosphodiesterase [Saccharospirillum sp. MSK14-1]|nr:phosphodiesterase [Saccharospirillum sp. MSK14-1]